MNELVKSALIGLGVAAGVGSVVLLATRRSKVRRGLVAPRRGEVPFAEVDNDLVWPVVTNHSRYGEVSYRGVDGEVYGNYARMFGAHRSGGSRHHVGIDLYANYWDPVVAMSDGVVVGIQSFHLGSYGILVEHDENVVLYGEVDNGSWREFGIKVGDKVAKGQPIARVACMNWSGSSCRSHMLHMESYSKGVTRNIRWYSGDDPPPELRDPTEMLLRAELRG